MKQIYLFTGENPYKLREEKQRWKAEFLKKYGDDSFSRLDGSTVSIRDLLDEVSVLPFLAEKRLIFVEGVPSSKKEEISVLEASIHPSVILVFIDAKSDKRSSGVKELLTIAEVKQFAPLKGKQVIDWMAQYAQSINASFANDAISLLIEFVGEDQDLLSQEMKKLALFADGRMITTQDVETMVMPSDEGIIWRISDLLCAGSNDKAFMYARRMLDRGGDAYGLWAILLSVLRNLVSVHAALAAGHSSPKDVADASGVHIFAIRSLLPYAKRAKEADIRAFLAWAAEADVALKTGTLRSTDDAPQEITSLVDSFLVKAP